MLNKGILFLLILGAIVAISCSPCKQGVENLEVVPWANVRAEIANYICVEVDTYPDGIIGHSFNHGTREPCVDARESTALARVVETVLKKARPLLLGIMAEHTGFVYDDSLPADTTNALLQEAFLSSEMFLRPILSELPRALAKNCLRCLDLPEFEQRPKRRVAWDEFKVYLSAYAWPDEVRDETNEDGDPTGKTLYSYHICVGLNGIADMIPDPDQKLAYVAYSIAINSDQFGRLARDHWREILRDENFNSLDTYSAKTAHQRQELPKRLAADKKLLLIACRFLKRYSDDFSMEIDLCSGDSP